MADSRDKRNFGCGRRLDAATINRLAEKVAHLSGRGSGLALQIRSALGRLAGYLRDSHDIRDLEKCTRCHIVGWIEDELRPAIVEEDIGRATGTFYVSAVNSVFRIFGRPDMWISSAEYGIGRGRKYCNIDLSNRPEDVKAYREWLLTKASANDGTRGLMYEALAHAQALQWTAGLRFRESLVAKMGKKDLTGSILEMQRGDGCKNNRSRTVHPLDGGEAIEDAQRFIQNHASVFLRGSLIPADQSYREYKSFARSALAEFRNETERALNHHGNRHRFAHEAYSRGWERRFGIRIVAPVKANIYGREHIRRIAEQLQIDEKVARQLDNEVRHELSRGLGHNRLDVTYSYVGR